MRRILLTALSLLVATPGLAGDANTAEGSNAQSPPAAAAEDIEIVGLAEGNRLLRFNASQPQEVTLLEVGGVDGELLGVDVRPADSRLYGVSTRDHLYIIDLETGAARRESTLNVAFEGSAESGFDFNPQADRLRLVAASGQNLRVHTELGAVATDGPLAYGAGDPNESAKPSIGAVAYTMNIAQAPTTKLFDIDWRLDVLALQEPPNDGGLQTIGPLGVDFGPRAGFDMVTREGQDTAYASSGATLYGIDLRTGTARALGRIGDGSIELIGLALIR